MPTNWVSRASGSTIGCFVNLDVFRSDYTNLQVQAIIYNPKTNTSGAEVKNAATARSRVSSSKRNGGRQRFPSGPTSPISMRTTSVSRTQVRWFLQNSVTRHMCFPIVPISHQSILVVRLTKICPATPQTTRQNGAEASMPRTACCSQGLQIHRGAEPLFHLELQ